MMPACAAIALMAAALAGPIEERVEVSLVLVPVVARDASGKPVLDLSREEFALFEDGVAQPLAAYGRESRPVSVLLALDTSESMRPNLNHASSAALEMVRAHAAAAAFALVVFNDGVYLKQDFTGDRRRIEAAIASTRIEGEMTALLDALSASSAHLATREGGRIAVVFTDGTDTLHPQTEAEKRLAGALEEAQRRDVALYTVAFGPRAATGLLRRVSEETGGEALTALSAGELTAAFRRIAESVGSRYLLGYRPPPGGKPGRRRIDVSVSRPGVTLTARRGWYAR